MSDVLILIYIVISLFTGVLFFYKGFNLKNKSPNRNLWKLFLFLGCLFTFIIPAIIIFFYFYYRRTYTIMCYEMVAKEIGLASTSIAVRKDLFNKFLKDNKISQKIYNKIYKVD